MAFMLRKLLFGVLFVDFIGAFLAMLFEPFAEEFLRQLGFDSSRWVSPVLSFHNSSTFPAGLLFLAGMTLGAMLHHLATRHDRRKSVEPRLTAAGSEDKAGPQQQAVSDWRMAYRNRDILRLREVASILSDVPLAHFADDPRYSARLEQIKPAILAGR